MRTIQTSMWETVEGHERCLEYMERRFGQDGSTQKWQSILHL